MKAISYSNDSGEIQYQMMGDGDWVLTVSADWGQDEVDTKRISFCNEDFQLGMELAKNFNEQYREFKNRQLAVEERFDQLEEEAQQLKHDDETERAEGAFAIGA